MNNWGPRLQADYRVRPNLVVHAGAALTTIPPNIWQDNMQTGNLPFVFYPRVTAGPTAFVPYGFQITPAQIPRVYTPDGTDIFANRRPNDVPRTRKWISLVLSKESQRLPKVKQFHSM